MRLRIVSDGTPDGTQVFDADTQQRITLPIDKIEWSVTVEGTARAILHVQLAEADVIGGGFYELRPTLWQFLREWVRRWRS